MPRTFFKDWKTDDGKNITVEYTFSESYGDDGCEVEILWSWYERSGEPVELSVEGREAIEAHIALTHEPEYQGRSC